MGFSIFIVYDNKEYIMKSIKKSQLREVFKKFDISEGVFDLFMSKKQRKLNQIEKELADLSKEADDIIKNAPTDAQRKQLRKLADAFDAVRNAHK